MGKLTRNVGLLLLAAGSVYFGQVGLIKAATPGKSAGAANPASVVKVLPEIDPFAVTPPVDTSANKNGTSVSTPVVNYSDAGTVEIHVNDANLVEVLRMLSLQSQKNIIASKDVRGTVTANLYDVTVREALDALLATNGYAYREKGNFIYVYTTKEIQDMERAARVATTATFRLYYTPAANAVTMIKPVLSSDAQVAFTTPAATGIDTGTKDVGGATHATEDVIVVTDYADNLERVRKVLKEVDRRPQQILIEATILRATLSEDNALGVDFTVLGNVDFSTINGAGATSGQALSGAITSNSAASSILDKGYSGAGTNFTQNVPSGGMRVGLVHNNIGVFLSALEQLTDTTVLANPKVLALNKQKGEVIVGRKDGYVTSTTTDTSTVQTVEFLDTGTRLIFRPFIGDDGYIRMEIHPEDSTGGLTAANLPFKATTEVTSNVMVKDGHTIVIGGLFREQTETTRAQVPGLGNIPGIGALFRSQRDRTTREEIIILLTPHIIKDDAAFSAASEAERKEMERLRVGSRRGMMWTGRERLAESYYDSAVKEMNKPTPNRSTVLWNLDCATNLNPRFREAIVLKEQITGEVVKSVDNSSIRYFVRDQILADKLNPPTTRPSSHDSLFEPIKNHQPMLNAPSTQPATFTSALVPQPSTQPAAQVVANQSDAVQAGVEVAESPATQPAAEVAEAPEAADVAEAPAPQPAAEVVSQTTNEVRVLDDVQLATPTEVVAAPATQPSDNQPAGAQVTITELPMDDAVPADAAPATGK